MDERDPMMEVVAKVVVAAVAFMFMAPYIQRVLAGSIPPAVAQAVQFLGAQAYAGLTDSRVLKAKLPLQLVNLVSDPPYHPWITAAFHNDGPHSVFVAINNPNEFTEIGSGGSISVDMSGADRRIEFIFYKCNVGETASVRVIGKY